MSVKYTPVQWNLNKYLYDLALIVMIAVYVTVFIDYGLAEAGHVRPIDDQIRNAAAFGSCAFFMLTAILCIGPLARLSPRFLPLLYNRRHFGVMTCLVALTHVYFILDWYFASSRTFPQYEAVLASNTAFGSLRGFPFEVFGIFTLFCLLILATTSHDFWLKFLGPKLWKGLHYLIYPAYASIVAHICFGVLQDNQHPAFAIIVTACALLVLGLHLAAAWVDRREARSRDRGAWVRVCAVDDVAEGRGHVVRLANGNRVAVFRHESALSALSNACAHQNGPLGEGRVMDGCATCPWHGFQYRLSDGCSPAPFTEKVPTYRLKIEDGGVWVDPNANPPGTPVPPVPIPGASMPTHQEVPA